MLHPRLATLLAVVSLACGLYHFTSAQTVTGTLSGTVTDATGAVVSSAKVTAKNTETGLAREGATNAEGYFNMPFLPLGVYDVTAEAQGFQKVVKTGVSVELNKNTVSNFKLEISSVGAEVRITGEAPQIETTTGEVKHSLTSKQIEDTPLAGRNFISLVEQIPGFQNAPWIGSSNNPTNSTGSYASFNGQGSRSATFQIDGVNNDDSSENQNRQNVNISTIKEVQVLTNAYSAEFGRAGGAVILVQTKSGTNQFHGDAYDFIQNDIFNANGFFSNRAGIDRQTVRRHQYGWTLGGPVWLPQKFFGPAAYDGRDRLFFFISGERVSNKTSSVIRRFRFLPGETPRACNPGEVAAPGGPYCVDPATHPNIQRDLEFMRSVQNLFDTPEMASAVPDPEGCLDLVASGRPGRCVRNTVQNTFPDSDYTGRLDLKATEKDNITLRYQYSRSIRRSGRIILGDNFGINNNRQYNLGLTATHVFSNRQVGEFRYGFGNRATLQDVVDDNAIPTIRFASTLCNSPTCGTVIGTSTNVPINRRQRDHQLVYNHTLNFSRHTLKAGIDQRFQALDDVSGDRSRGFWTFGTLAGSSFTGWENFLLGFVTGYQKGFGNPEAENRFGETNLYLEDKYTVRHNLTLNFGVRYEYVRAPVEIENRFEYGFGDDKNNIEPRIGFAWSPSAEGGALRRITGDAGNFAIRGGYGIYHSRLFQSIFSQNQLSIRTQPPNGFAQDFSGLCRNEISDPSCGFAFTPGVATRSASFTAASANNTGVVRDTGGRLLSTLLIPDPKLQMPYVQQWNLTVERQLPSNFAIHIGYNGNRGIGLPFYNGDNQPIFPFTSPSLLVDVGGGNFRPVVFDRACRDFSDPICVLTNASGAIDVNNSGALRNFSALNSTTATLAQKGIVIENGVPHGYISLSQPRTNERRPDPNFIRNVALQNFTWSYYHALIAKVSKRLSHGLSFTGTYTFSKAIDTGSEATFTGVDTNTPTNKLNAAASLRGLSGFHSPHRFVASYSYELPIFRARRDLLGTLFGGWNVTGITVLQTGNPFTVVAGYDVNADGVGSDRPRIADVSLLGKRIDDGRQSPGGTGVSTGSEAQLPAGGFIPAQAGTISAINRIFAPGVSDDGTVGRNTFFSDGLNYTDLTASKEFRFKERFKLALRMEFYNIFNQVMFDVPARTILSTTPLGRITSQRNPANFVNSGRDNGSRMGQLALRLVF
jgi:Carboxypeptidase regulatory-like domain/TonB-dependent Receptor Plug Domain